MRARIYIARKKYIAKQTAKLEAEYSKSVAKQRGFIKVQKVVRQFLAKQRILRLRAAHPQVAIVSVLASQGLALPEGTGEVSAFVSGLSLSIPVGRKDQVSDDMLKQCGQITSVFKYGPIGKSSVSLALRA